METSDTLVDIYYTASAAAYSPIIPPGLDYTYCGSFGASTPLGASLNESKKVETLDSMYLIKEMQL